jgi:hypothetical protein
MEQPMKTKAISLTLATLMAVQTTAMANTDRTQGIGQQAVLTAQENMAAISAQIITLDQSLERAAKAVEKRDNDGGITNSIAVATAVVGVGLSAAAYFSIHSGGEGRGIAAMMAGGMSIGASIVSAVSGLSSQGLKASVDTQELEAQIKESQKSIETAIAQSTDKATSVSLTQLNLALTNSLVALNEYQSEKSTESKVRLASQGAQVAGIATSILGLTTKTNGALFIGSLLMNAGNLTAAIAGLGSEDAQTVLKEIQQTRDSLKLAQAGLK